VARHINPTLLTPHIAATMLDEELQDVARLHTLSMNPQAVRSAQQIAPERIAFSRCCPMSTMTSLEKLRLGTLHFDPALESIWISGAQAPPIPRRERALFLSPPSSRMVRPARCGPHHR